LADTIYWTNFSDNTIRGAPLAGGGPVETLYDSAQGVSGPLGVVVDPAAGQIYWANDGDDTIQRAPLAPGGTPDSLYDSGQGVSGPGGVAIDAAAGRIYWTNYGDNTIQRAPLAPGGTPEPLYDSGQGVSIPVAVAIDPAADRIYWGNGGSSEIRRAPLASRGTPDTLYASAQGAFGPIGVAVDPNPAGPAPERLAVGDAGRFPVGRWLSDLFSRRSYSPGRIYWTNFTDGRGGIYVDNKMRGAPLVPGGAVAILYDAAHGISTPGKVAIDPNPAGPAPERLAVGDAERFTVGRWLRDLFSRPSGSPGRIYWGNGGDNTIRGGPLAPGGTPDTLYVSAQGVSSPSAVAVLRAPVGTGAPTISWSLILDDEPFGGLQFGGSHSGPLGQRLSCSRGAWAADLPGSFLYRAPQSFAYQWRLGGNDIGGANAADFTPNAPGSYTCQVIATNGAGNAAQTSAPLAVS
jgi:hypothetical protein